MVQPISPRAAQQLLQQADLDVVDVREPNEWSTGHLPGARLVPLAKLRRSPTSELSRDGVLFVCAAGVRSETAARLALQHGFSKVYSLTGGTRGWSREGLPLVRD